MGIQFNLDFDGKNLLVDDGKLTEKLTFTGSEELKDLIGQFAVLQNLTPSELCRKYVCAGLSKDFRNRMIRQAFGDKLLKDLKDFL